MSQAGDFRNDDGNRQGILTFANGTQQVGQFKDGKYLRLSTSFEVALQKRPRFLGGHLKTGRFNQRQDLPGFHP